MRTLEEILQSTWDVLFLGEEEEREVKIDSCSMEGDTALHIILWRKDYEAALTLISAGANPNAEGDMKETPLHVAVRQGSAEVVQALLIAGSNPDARSEFGETPRDMAAEKGGIMASILEAAPSKRGKV